MTLKQGETLGSSLFPIRTCFPLAAKKFKPNKKSCSNKKPTWRTSAQVAWMVNYSMDLSSRIMANLWLEFCLRSWWPMGPKFCPEIWMGVQRQPGVQRTQTSNWKLVAKSHLNLYPPSEDRCLTASSALGPSHSLHSPPHSRKQHLLKLSLSTHHIYWSYPPYSSVEDFLLEKFCSSARNVQHYQKKWEVLKLNSGGHWVFCFEHDPWDTYELLGSPLSKIEWEEVSLNNVQCHSESGTVVIKFTRVMIQGVQEIFFTWLNFICFLLYRENSPTNHRKQPPKFCTGLHSERRLFWIAGRYNIEKL
jgi:hypothetical protein